MRYTRTARWLHWLTVLALLAVGVLGLWIGWAPPDDEAFKLRLYNAHESIGILILPLTLFRLGWRWANPPPPEVPQPAALQLAAACSHAVLYALLLTMPVMGLLATNAWGFPLRIFGLLPVPSPIGHDEAVAPVLTALHGWMALVLGLVVAVHALAALLWHGVIRRDGVLRRMI